MKSARRLCSLFGGRFFNIWILRTRQGEKRMENIRKNIRKPHYTAIFDKKA